MAKERLTATYAYARISRDKEASVSVEDQLKRIKAYAEAMNRRIDGAFIDRGESGRSFERPEMTRLLSLLKPGDTVMVLKLDRLTRSIRDLGQFLESGFHLVSVHEHLDTASASGRLITNILGVVAQWEREVIAERTVSALAYKRQNNAAYGSVPYGYRRNGAVLEPCPSEQEVLELIRRHIRAGRSMKSLLQILNESFIDRARGKQWYSATVRSIVNSKKYQETAKTGTHD